MALKSTLASVFKSRDAENLDTVRSKLDAAREVLAAIDLEMPERALEAAVGDDAAREALAALERRRADAARQVELMELAETEAQRRETARLASARSDAEKARQRAIAAHTGALTTAAASFTAACEAQLSAYREMQKAAGRIAAASRHSELHQSFGQRHGPADVVAQSADLEAFRIADGSPWLRRPDGFGSFHGLVGHGKTLSDIRPLAERLRQRFGSTSASPEKSE